MLLIVLKFDSRGRSEHAGVREESPGDRPGVFAQTESPEAELSFPTYKERGPCVQETLTLPTARRLA